MSFPAKKFAPDINAVSLQSGSAPVEPAVARIHQSIVDTTSNTPMVELKLPALNAKGKVRVLLKLEYFNPLSSIKDRVGRAMVEQAEAAGLLDRNTYIIEATSGNTGISLAFIAASRGYRLILTMPESMSVERQNMLRALGATVVLTPASQRMDGAIQKAESLAAELPFAWVPRQFENPANPRVHELTTGPEIWHDAGGEIDVFVAGVGTGGTITGVSRFLHAQNAGIRTIAVEPAESPVLSGGKPAPHRIQGIGAGFVPKNLDRTRINEIQTVTYDDAVSWTRRLAQEAGILAGISTGANLSAVAKIARRADLEGKTIVTVAASAGERYLTTGVFPRQEDRATPSLLELAHSRSFSI